LKFKRLRNIQTVVPRLVLAKKKKKKKKKNNKHQTQKRKKNETTKKKTNPNPKNNPHKGGLGPVRLKMQREEGSKLRGVAQRNWGEGSHQKTGFLKISDKVIAVSVIEETVRKRGASS